MKNFLTPIAAICIACTVGFGCQSHDYQIYEAEAPYSGEATEKLVADSSKPGLLSFGAELEDSSDQSSANVEIGIERKIIYTGEFSLAVASIEDAQTKFADTLASYKGYVQRQTSDTIVARVPAEHFQSFTSKMSEIGRVVSKEIEAQDVTEAFFDIELRLKTRKEYLESLRDLLNSAGKLEEKLAVQREIGDVLEEIEVLEGRMRYLSQMISYSTVTVYFSLGHDARAAVMPLMSSNYSWLWRVGVDHFIGK